jgi:hypothetical protein
VPKSTPATIAMIYSSSSSSFSRAGEKIPADPPDPARY